MSNRQKNALRLAVLGLFLAGASGAHAYFTHPSTGNGPASVATAAAVTIAPATPTGGSLPGRERRRGAHDLEPEPVPGAGRIGRARHEPGNRRIRGRRRPLRLFRPQLSFPDNFGGGTGWCVAATIRSTSISRRRSRWARAPTTPARARPSRSTWRLRDEPAAPARVGCSRPSSGCWPLVSGWYAVRSLRPRSTAAWPSRAHAKSVAGAPQPSAERPSRRRPRHSSPRLGIATAHGSAPAATVAPTGTFTLSGRVVGTLFPGSPALPVELVIENPAAAPLTVEAVDHHGRLAPPGDSLRRLRTSSSPISSPRPWSFPAVRRARSRSSGSRSRAGRSCRCSRPGRTRTPARRARSRSPSTAPGGTAGDPSAPVFSALACSSPSGAALVLRRQRSGRPSALRACPAAAAARSRRRSRPARRQAGSPTRAASSTCNGRRARSRARGRRVRRQALRRRARARSRSPASAARARSPRSECTETTPPGSWRYTVTPLLDSWTGGESGESGAVVVSSASLTLAPTVVGGARPPTVRRPFTGSVGRVRER